uniref:Uncharacterized protein n=1 Tax=Anguilla anguilla TaxID=7936 RepID=A0A0E9RN81_ANGAN
MGSRLINVSNYLSVGVKRVSCLCKLNTLSDVK